MFSKLDLIALAWFLAAWIGYSLAIELTRHGKSGLNGLMHHYRSHWMERMLARETRMMDAQVISALQNGTAFFASTSLIALGGAVKLVHSNEDMLTIVAAPPFGEAVTHTQWELKVVGLMIIFIYAFFKFAWAYRLHNHATITVGAAPARLRAGRAGGEGLCAIRRDGHHRCRPPFQPRSAGVLFRARLSRLVFRSAAACRNDGSHSCRHVATAIRVHLAPGGQRGLSPS
jgi:hypothetical protein